MNDLELLRTMIIALAAVNSVIVTKIEDGISCNGKRRYFVTAYVGGAGCVIFALSVIISAAVRVYLLEKFALGFAESLVQILCVLLFLSLLQSLSRLWKLEKYNYLIFINSILLGTLLINTEVIGVGKTVIRSVIYSIYFIPAVLLFSRIRTRVDESEATPCFAGLPVILLSGAFLSLALSGILGIAEKLFT